MILRIYVEGGGDHNKALTTECRKGFSEFLSKAGFRGRMPKVIACGGRLEAFKRFRTAQEGSPTDSPLLLVDSESPLSHQSSWTHVQLRPGDLWQRPSNATDDQLHLMVQTMEAWFHCDVDALVGFFGKGFRPNALSSRTEIEEIPKSELLDGLKKATKDCKKGEYSKGGHSFQILAKVDPVKVRSSSPNAERLLTCLDQLSSNK